MIHTRAVLSFLLPTVCVRPYLSNLASLICLRASCAALSGRSNKLSMLAIPFCISMWPAASAMRSYSSSWARRVMRRR